MVTQRAAWLVVLCCAACAALSAAEKKPSQPTPASAAVAAIGSTAEPCAELVNVARSHGIPLKGMDRFTDGVTVEPGDSLSALVTLVEKSRRTQWLLYLKAGETNSAGATQVKTNASKRVMYSSTGKKFEFRSTPVSVSLRTLGPYDASERKRKVKAKDTVAKLSVDQGYLAVGLDKAARAVMRLGTRKPKIGYAFAARPFGDKEIAETRKRTNNVALTIEEERALAGTGPALESYFTIVQETEGLSDILYKLVDLPSMWSIARHKGVVVNFRFLNEIKEREVKAGSLSVYEIPLALELNDQRSLNIVLVATTPRPPLLPCAGIMGLVATRPGATDSFLAVQVLSATRGGLTTKGVVSSAPE
jgi:hypothetical protein